MSTLPAVVDRGISARQEFGATQVQSQAETAMAAVSAREQAAIQAEYIMAERHPRNWANVRAAMMDHCTRPRFADVSRYAKPIGKEKVNGEWVEKKARGFSARFTETLAQEMGNLKPWSQVTYEDDMIRIVRIGVTDLQKNLPRSREVTFAKAVEKRGKQDKKTKEWTPPEGREVISQRINSYGDPVYLVKATEDEMRSKVNSEESKTQRDFITRLCPRDILEDCEEKITEVLSKEDKRDPLAARKKILDRFHEFRLMPSDLEQYIGRPVDRWTLDDLAELRELGAGIRDGQITFDEALKIRYSSAEGEPGSSTAADNVADEKLRQMEAERAARQAQQSQSQQTTQSSPEADKRPAGDQTPTTGDRPAQQTSEPHLFRYDSWADLDDQTDPRLGLKVEVGGVLFTRGTTDQTWTRVQADEKPKTTKPVFGRPR